MASSALRFLLGDKSKSIASPIFAVFSNIAVGREKKVSGQLNDVNWANALAMKGSGEGMHRGKNIL